MKKEKSICPTCGALLMSEEEHSSRSHFSDRDTQDRVETCVTKQRFSCPFCDYKEEEYFDDILAYETEYEPCKD